jgi:hypothetical protein
MFLKADLMKSASFIPVSGETKPPPSPSLPPLWERELEEGEPKILYAVGINFLFFIS